MGEVIKEIVKVVIVLGTDSISNKVKDRGDVFSCGWEGMETSKHIFEVKSCGWR